MPETNTTLPPAVDENYANFIFNYNSSPSYLAYLKQNYQNLQTLETLKRYQENKILLIVSTADCLGLTLSSIGI